MLSHLLRCCLELSVVCQAILEYDLDAKKVSEGTGGEQVYGENNGEDLLILLRRVSTSESNDLYKF